MAVILRDVLEETGTLYHLELIAGENGLNRVMRWVYVAEDYSTADFLRGGELIITTGALKGGDASWLSRFLPRMIGRGTCGLILNEGPYLKRREIPEEILALCSSEAYPLFLMPWNIHIYDITRNYYGRIFADAQRDETVSRALRSLMEPGADCAQALSVLPDYHFPADAPYRVAVFCPKEPQKTPPAENEALMNRLYPALSRFPHPWSFAGRSGLLFFVCQGSSSSETEQAAGRLLELAGTGFYAGLSGEVSGLRALARGCAQARAAANLGLHRGLSLCRYEDLGFFRLLLELSEPSVLDSYIREKLGPVQEYDAAHKTDLTRTLRSYLLSNGSIQETSEALFCHRNTIRHRLTLIQQLLGRSLEDAGVRFELLAAYLGEEYQEICRGH